MCAQCTHACTHRRVDMCSCLEACARENTHWLRRVHRSKETKQDRPACSPPPCLHLYIGNIHIYIYTHMCIYTYICVYIIYTICTYVIYICVYTYIYIYAFICIERDIHV